MQICFGAFTKKIVTALLLLLPVGGCLMAQDKTTKKILTAKQVSAIPAVQRIIADSLAATYGLRNPDGLPLLFSSFDTADNNYHKNLYRYIQQKAGLKQWKSITENAIQLNPVKGGAQQLTSLLPGLYALKSKASLQQYNPFTNTSLRLHQTELQAVTGNQFGLQKNYTSLISTGGTLIIAGVPLSASLQTGYPAFFTQQPSAMFKFSFDKTGFQQKLKQNLNDQFDLKKYALSGFNFEKILKDYAQSFVQNINQEFSGLKEMEVFISRLNKLSVEEVLHLSTDQLEEKIFSSINQQQFPINETIHADSLQQMIANCKNKIRLLKEQFGQKGLDMNALLRYQQMVNKNIDSLTGAPDFVNNAAKELLTMSGLSKFFTKMKNFNAGQFSSGWSEKTLSGIFMSGIGGDFKSRQFFTGLNIFENRPLAPVKDNQFNKVFDQPNQFIQALRIGNGDITGNHTHITTANAKTFNRQWAGNNQLSAIPRNAFAGTVSNQINIGNAGTIQTELSKTSTAYQNGVTGIDGQITETISALNGFIQDFWQTVSVGLNYQNQYKQIGLEHQLTFNYSGLGYNNPATAFSARGVIQGGIALKKSIYKNKGIVQIRYQRKNNYTSTEKGNFFKQDRLHIVAKWKLSNNLKAGFSWNSAVMEKMEQKNKTPIFQQTRGSFDASYRGKINGKPFMQLITAGYQHFSFTGNAGELPGKMVIINSVTNLSLSKAQMQINMQYLHDASSEVTDRSSLFTSDMGLGLPLAKMMQLTTSLTWLSQTGRVKQLGIRNSINGQVGKRWQLSIFGDLRKNLTPNQNPIFFPAARGEIMLQYLIQ
jgi:hypothetical protein